MDEEIADTGSVDSSQAPVLEIGDQPSREFLDFFAKLDPNINGELVEKAWKQYDTTGQQIVLEGSNQSVWMACAFFTSVWQATSPVGHQKHELIWHYSLSKLLQLCQVSVLEFFDKLNKWAEMIMATRRLLDYINRVQSNLAVTVVILKKFLPIFRHAFGHVLTQQTRQSPQKARHQNTLSRLNSASLFEFTWLFYIAMRKQLPPNQEDLMTAYHLLLCVVDYVYTALEQISTNSPYTTTGNLHRLLNPAFAQSLTDHELTPLESLCKTFEAATLDAKHLRVHWMLPQLKTLSAEGAIGPLGAAIFANFEHTRQAFEELYEQAMMARSEIDDRVLVKPLMANIQAVFRGEMDEKITTFLRQFGDNGQEMDVDLLMKMNLQKCLEKLDNRKPTQTPIAGKSYVITPETVCPSTAINVEMKPAEKVEQLLTEYKNADEHILDYLFDECHDNPREYVAEQLLKFTRKLMDKVDEEMAADFNVDFGADIGTQIPNIESLFYYLLDRIVTFDRERALNMGSDFIDMGAIFQSKEFLASVYICAADLVLWAHESSKRQFPWVADLFHDTVAPINFYRIIELIVRSDTSLSKEMAKHFNRVEECVLEELAWTNDSPIWPALDSSSAVEQLGEISPVPGSQILARTYMYTQRHADLPQTIIIFFKKVYHLATIRLTDLCERVRIMDDLTRQKIWTLFEHIFRMQISLLRDRHLDQLLMCSIYIIAKACNLNITFQDIMYHYRHQPQAASRVYRQVLLGRPYDPVQQQPADEKQSNGQAAERADLIKFYNMIFVSRVQEFVKLLHPSGSDSKENLVPLTLMPKVPLNPLSPRKLVTDRINVVPMSQYAQSISLSRVPGLNSMGRRYDIHKSPSKDLKNINAMLRGGGGGGGSSTSNYYGTTSQSGRAPIY